VTVARLAIKPGLQNRCWFVERGEECSMSGHSKDFVAQWDRWKSREHEETKIRAAREGFARENT